MSQYQIAVVVGSLRKDSYNRQLAQAITQLAPADFGFVFVEIGDLPLYNQDDDANQADSVKRMKAEIAASQGVIFVTPEYNRSISGVLKNALDLMGFSEFEGKTIGLLGVSGGRMGAAHALAGLRTASRSLRAWVLPSEVSIPQVSQQFDANGLLKDADLAQRVKDLGRQVARFAFLHSSQQAMSFLRAWEEAPVNPGGEWSS